ncbi:right-handed parallel beta-helix repeat-containing protein, partial [Desulfonatronospira sp. MSAO_Bac3]|uniref:InlB B-repeat-containing protein n=1 Tax=Desulfonatronospira sp. MSAO_Bac3 TaxID=2293857 RepID=UPI000FF8179C
GDTALPVVGSDFSDMYPGSFWYDEDMGSLYVWLPDGSSPENYVMEASVRDFLLAPNSLDYINLEGLVFAHSNTGTSGEEVSMLNISGTGWKLEDNFFLMADMSGLSLSGRDHLLSGNTFLLNGYAGLVLRGHEDQGEERQILMSGNEQSYNNTRNFDFSLKPGGINITDGCSGLTIENNLAWRNHMFGVSMDSQSKDIVLEKSFFQDNILGVYAEETDSIIVKNNIFNENFYAAGLDSTSNTHVLFNTFHANEYAFTAMDSMGDSPLFQNNHIQNNLFSDSLIVDLGLYIPDFLDEGNTSDYNAYARASQEIANIWIDEIGFPVFSFSLSSFQDQSGLDQNSVVSASIWPEEHDFAFVPPHDALIIDAGSLELQAVLSDFYGRERPWGMGPDIGAVEYYPDEDIPEYPHELAELDPSVPEQPPEPDMWEISVSVTGEGQVKVNPDQTEYMDGSMVELSVHAGDGWYFVQWQGDLSGSETPVTLVVDEDKNISALFERLYTLSISVEGEGSIIRTPDLSEYESGESVELEAVAADGWEFVGWSGDASGTDTSLVLVMDTDTSVTGVFEEIPEPEPEGEVFVFDPNAYETGYNPVGDVFIQRLPGSSDFGGDTGIAEVSTPVGNKVMQFTTELSSPYFHGGVRWLYWTEFQRDQDQIEFLYLFRRSDPEYTELLGCMRMSGEAELNTYAAGLRNNSDEIRGRRVLQGNIINAGEENHNLSGDTVGDWIWV